MNVSFAVMALGHRWFDCKVCSVYRVDSTEALLNLPRLYPGLLFSYSLCAIIHIFVFCICFYLLFILYTNELFFSQKARGRGVLHVRVMVKGLGPGRRVGVKSFF